MKPLYLACLLFVLSPAGGARTPRSQDPPYADLVQEVVEAYRRQQQEENEDETTAEDFSSEAEQYADAYNAPSPQAAQLAAQNEERELQVETLSLLTGDDTDAFLRNVDLVARQYSAVDYCSRGSNLACNFSSKFRTIDGTCNNVNNPQWGMTLAQHKRRLPNAYENGRWKPRNTSSVDKNLPLPNPRAVSNGLHASTTSDQLSESSISMALFAWGQFLDHDVASTPAGGKDKNIRCCTSSKNNNFCLAVYFPDNDPFFGSGHCMEVRRSETERLCSDNKVRNQLNQITGFVDSSNVYGSSHEEELELRSFIGGYLKTETGNYPPDGDINECRRQNPIPCLLTGDHRANVVPTLATIHTLFVREHNRIAAELGRINPGWDDEKIYQEARRIVSAEIQQITYGEYLPKIFNAETMQTFGLYLKAHGYSKDYNPSIDPTVASSFMVAYRFGHSWIPRVIHRLGPDYKNIATTPTERTFLTPHELFAQNYGGINDIGRFTADSLCPRSDRIVEDAARNKLFETSKGGDGLDLMVLNIVREREWGVPAYVHFRRMCGYPEVTNWDDLSTAHNGLPATHSAEVVRQLQAVYNYSSDIDLLPGLLTETHLPNSLTGPTMACLLAEQFRELKHGDRYWYEEELSPGRFTPAQLTEIRKMTLSKIMCHNLDIASIQEDAFLVPIHVGRKMCEELKSQSMDLGLWRGEQ